MTKLVGFERKFGTFTSSSGVDIEYDNVYLYLLDDTVVSDKSHLVGSRTEQLKVKYVDLKRIFKCTFDELSAFLDCYLRLDYSIFSGKIVLSSAEFVLDNNK